MYVLWECECKRKLRFRWFFFYFFFFLQLSWLHSKSLFSTIIFLTIHWFCSTSFIFLSLLIINNSAANDIFSVAHFFSRLLLIVLFVYYFISSDVSERVLLCSFEHIYACALVIICSIFQLSCFKDYYRSMVVEVCIYVCMCL